MNSFQTPTEIMTTGTVPAENMTPEEIKIQKFQAAVARDKDASPYGKGDFPQRLQRQCLCREADSYAVWKHRPPNRQEANSWESIPAGFPQVWRNALRFFPGPDQDCPEDRWCGVVLLANAPQEEELSPARMRLRRRINFSL